MFKPSAIAIAPALMLEWTHTRPLMRVLSVVVVVLAITVLGAQFYRAARASLFVDTEAYYAAASNVRDGERLYERALAWRDSKWTLGGPRAVPDDVGMDYSYPPLLALLFVPLTLLPFEIVGIVWLTIGFASLISAVHLLTGMFVVSGLARRAVFTLGASAVCAVFQPVRASLLFGNVDCLLLLLLSLSLVAFLAGRDHRAGAWLALAVAVKPMLGLLVLFFIWKRCYRSVAAFLAVVTAAVVLPLVVVGVAALGDMVAAGNYFSSEYFAANSVNQSPYGLLLRLFTVTDFSLPIVDAPALVPIGRGAAAIGAALMLVRAVSRTRALSAPTLTLEFGLFIVAGLLVSPLSEDIHYTHLVIPLTALGAMLTASGARDRGMLLATAGFVGLVLYFSMPRLTVIKLGLHDGTAPLQMPRLLLTGVHVYGLLALAALSLVCLNLQRRWKATEPRLDPLLVHEEER